MTTNDFEAVFPSPPIGDFPAALLVQGSMTLADAVALAVKGWHPDTLAPYGSSDTWELKWIRMAKERNNPEAWIRVEMMIRPRPQGGFDEQAA